MVRSAIGLFVSAIIVLLVFLPSYTRMQDLRQKNTEYGHQVRDLVRKNGQLREEKRRLKEDPVYLEKIAREKMGLIREGEVVYKLVPVNQNKEGQ